MYWSAAQERSRGFRPGPLAVFGVLLENRRLIARLVRRDIQSRYRGSLLGVLWALLTPLLLLTIFTFVFTVVFQARWDVQVEGRGFFALSLFTGMILFYLFSDSVTRAPTLITENPSYVKKVVFPLEVLAWVTVIGGLFNAALSTLVLMVAYVALLGVPPWTALLLPIVLVPFIPLILGSVWFLASVGVFLRDVRQVIGVVTMMLMFMSPVFYPVSRLPEQFQAFIYLSPLTVAIQEARGLLFQGELPDWTVFAAYALAAWAVAWLGLVWFEKTRSAFADAV